MGISYHFAKLLCDARQGGASFERTITVGRQTLALHPSEVTAIEQAVGRRLGNYQFGDFADDFLKGFVGARELSVLDNSDYQAATVLHDMNEPIEQRHWGQFDAVIDGGSLEHVFNFPVAAANLMRMTRLGGSLFLANPANNLCGHGFYQFSPELMFRVFSADNGFELKQVVFLEGRFPSVEKSRIRRAYRVADPATVRERVMLTSSNPTMMLVEARKVANVVPFSSAPQQSDYVALWHEGGHAPAGPSWRRRLASLLPGAVRGTLAGYLERRKYSLSNRRFYRGL